MGFNKNTIYRRYLTEKSIFFERNMRFKKFKNIDEEREANLRKIASIWNNTHTFDNVFSKHLSFFILLKKDSQKKFNTSTIPATFDAQSSDEELLLYIFVADPELKLLQLYFEGNNINVIKQRFLEEFGYAYDSRLLTIEKVYNNRFNKVVDEFENSKTLTKKQSNTY